LYHRADITPCSGLDGLSDDGDEPVSLRSRRIWTSDEDDSLRKAVSQVGENDFKKVASLVPNRSAKQCRERWFNNLAPKIKKSRLSKKEWSVVVQAQKEIGNRSLLLSSRLFHH